MLEAAVHILHLLSAFGVITLVLFQRGSGVDAGVSLGAGGVEGASNTVFGSQGNSHFLRTCTAIFAVIFFGTSLSLGYIAKEHSKTSSVITQPDIKSTYIKENKLIEVVEK